MTLRDLTPREIYNLQRRCERLLKEWRVMRHPERSPTEQQIWNKAYDTGLKDGLAKGERK